MISTHGEMRSRSLPATLCRASDVGWMRANAVAISEKFCGNKGGKSKSRCFPPWSKGEQRTAV